MWIEIVLIVRQLLMKLMTTTFQMECMKETNWQSVCMNMSVLMMATWPMKRSMIVKMFALQGQMLMETQRATGKV
jgi:hypothetical protein